MALGNWFNVFKGDKQQEPADNPLPDNLIQLHRLKRQHQLLAVHIGGIDRQFQSLLLDIDAMGEHIVLDQLFPRITNPQRLVGRKLAVHSPHLNPPARFEAEVMAIRDTAAGHDLVLKMPNVVECTQRRASYRVPVDKSAQFHVALQTSTAGKLQAKPINLSIDGIRFELAGNFANLENALAALFMQVGDEPLMACQLKICNLETVGDPNAQKTIMGARFIQLSPPQRKILERFVLRTQQEMRQKELANR
jgi:c-di-GMP-binding flagellar brake protein YcgR